MLTNLEIFENVESFKNPIDLAKKWLEQAQVDSKMTYPNAMTLATVNAQGQPSIRVVLLKEIRSQGFVFYTNYNSRKGQEMHLNSHVAADFYWDAPFRQIKIKGQVSKTSREDSVNYWNSRPKESQISQYVSFQSQKAPSQLKLKELYDKASQDFENKSVPCPEHWGGYVLEPSEIIFWIGTAHRFHNVFLFTKSPARLPKKSLAIPESTSHWLVERLYP